LQVACHSTHARSGMPANPMQACTACAHARTVLPGSCTIEGHRKLPLFFSCIVCARQHQGCVLISIDFQGQAARAAAIQTAAATAAAPAAAAACMLQQAGGARTCSPAVKLPGCEETRSSKARVASSSTCSKSMAPPQSRVRGRTPMPLSSAAAGRAARQEWCIRALRHNACTLQGADRGRGATGEQVRALGYHASILLPWRLTCMHPNSRAVALDEDRQVVLAPILLSQLDILCRARKYFQARGSGGRAWRLQQGGRARSILGAHT